MAMPWSKAKAIRAEYLSGARDKSKLTALFDACFRIQREAIEAASRFIPLVVENVRGAQEWVGRSRWNFGSFHLWGDVPALMPMTAEKPMKNTGGSWFTPPEGRKCRSKNCPDGRKSGDIPWLNDSLQSSGIKGSEGYDRDHPNAFGWAKPATSSRSIARKAHQAMIAKIPLTLSQHIANVYKPREVA